MTDITKMPLENLMLSNKAKLVKENFFELDLVGQGFIVNEYLKKVEYDDLQGILSTLAQREINQGYNRHDFMDSASNAYSELKDDDDENV